MFAEKITELGSAKNFEHRIITTGPPISFRPHRGISTLKPVIKQHVDELLKCGIIRKSRSPYAAGIVMVRKPKDNSWRVCIDYRRWIKWAKKMVFHCHWLQIALICYMGQSTFQHLTTLVAITKYRFGKKISTRQLSRLPSGIMSIIICRWGYTLLRWCTSVWWIP